MGSMSPASCQAQASLHSNSRGYMISEDGNCCIVFDNGTLPPDGSWVRADNFEGHGAIVTARGQPPEVSCHRRQATHEPHGYRGLPDGPFSGSLGRSRGAAAGQRAFQAYPRYTCLIKCTTTPRGRLTRATKSVSAPVDPRAFRRGGGAEGPPPRAVPAERRSPRPNLRPAAPERTFRCAGCCGRWGRISGVLVRCTGAGARSVRRRAAPRGRARGLSGTELSGVGADPTEVGKGARCHAQRPRSWGWWAGLVVSCGHIPLAAPPKPNLMVRLKRPRPAPPAGCPADPLPSTFFGSGATPARENRVE